MKKNTFLILLLTSLCSLAQTKFSKKISFTNDNDLYVSTYRDRYYTNGMFLNYHYVSNFSSDKIEKKIYTISLGHEMFTPYKAVVESVILHDRPFAAHLFGNFGITNFYKNSSLLNISLQGGIIGESAYGRELMGVVHSIYAFREATGWDYQISNALSLNVNIAYLKKLTSQKAIFDINWQNEARAGTVYSDVSTGIYSRIGIKPLEKLANSIAFNSNLNHQKSKFYNSSEFFLFIKPMLTYVAYDATIEGSFLNNTSPVTFEVEPIKFSTEIGIQFTANRFNFGYTFIYHTKKLKSTQVPNQNTYGRIQLSYLFN